MRRALRTVLACAVVAAACAATTTTTSTTTAYATTSSEDARNMMCDSVSALLEGLHAAARELSANATSSANVNAALASLERCLGMYCSPQYDVLTMYNSTSEA